MAFGKNKKEKKSKKKGKAAEVAPVSYTHLDVYKRQPSGYALRVIRQ